MPSVRSAKVRKSAGHSANKATDFFNRDPSPFVKNKHSQLSNSARALLAATDPLFNPLPDSLDRIQMRAARGPRHCRNATVGQLPLCVVPSMHSSIVLLENEPRMAQHIGMQSWHNMLNEGMAVNCAPFRVPKNKWTDKIVSMV